MAALETSLRSERQQNDAIMKQLAESQGEIGELQRKLEDADARNGLLQDSLQRFHYYLVSISSVMFQLPCYPSVKITHHVSELIWVNYCPVSL
jgi:septal ring factor EnvC (AmiA/AmiB activator)